MPISFDDLAAHLHPSYQCLERRQRHRAARYLFASPPERLVQLGGVNAVQPDELIGHDDSVAVDNFGAAGQAVGTPPERQNGDETPDHSATARCQISGRAYVGWGYRFVCFGASGRTDACMKASAPRRSTQSVRRTGEGDPLKFEVGVRSGSRERRHHLTMARKTLPWLAAGSRAGTLSRGGLSVFARPGA